MTQDQLLPPVYSSSIAAAAPTATPFDQHRHTTPYSRHPIILAQGGHVKHPEPTPSRRSPPLSWARIGFTPAGLSLLKPSHHPSPSCRSGSPTSMSHRYGLADAATLHSSSQTVLCPALPCHSPSENKKVGPLTSCSPSREDDPVNRRRVPLLAIYVIYLASSAVLIAKRCCIHCSASAAQ